MRSLRSRCTRWYASSWNSDIAAGRYQPGQKFPSEAALVKRFGASRITVGRAVRELQRAACWTAWPARAPTCAAASRQRRKRLLFGLVIPNLGETEIFEPICQGIAASPDAEGHALLWAHADQAAPRREEQALELARSRSRAAWPASSSRRWN